jgi:hypothetical protein
MNAYSQVINALIDSRAYKATKYLAPNVVVNATRIVKGGRIDGRDASAEIYVKVGKPNFLERQFVKAAIKAGQTFPIRKVQIKALPKRRSK